MEVRCTGLGRIQPRSVRGRQKVSGAGVVVKVAASLGHLEDEDDALWLRRI